MKIFLKICICFALFSSNNLFSQVEVLHHSIVNNDTNLISVLASNTSKSVVFFCPIAKLTKESFYKKSEELSKNWKMKGLSDLTLHFVYFKQDLKSNAKGLKLINVDKKDTLFIGQFECFFVGFNTDYLFRAKSKMKYNYEIEEAFKNENTYKVPIVDTNKCFEKIQDRIPFYADFIKESIQPIFSNDEKIQFLRDSVNLLFKEIELLKLSILNKEDVIQKNKTNQNKSPEETPEKNLSPVDRPKNIKESKQ